MNNVLRSSLYTIGLSLLCVQTGCKKNADVQTIEQAPSPCSTETIATLQDAYIYGYPMVMMALTQSNSLDPRTASATRTHASMNRFAHNRAYPDHNSKTVVKPNRDTYYSTAWLDLKNGPVLLTSPEIENYHLYAFYDSWTNVFATLGTRDGDTGPLSVMIVGPDWQGDDDAYEHNIIRAPTNLVWTIFRFQADDGETGQRQARNIQDQLHIRELNNNQPQPLEVSIPGQGLLSHIPTEAIEQMDSLTFFQTLMDLMQNNAPPAADQPMIERLANLGLTPGANLNTSPLFQGQCGEIENIPEKTAQHFRKLKQNTQNGGLTNGWLLRRTGLGKYGTNYALRAYVAKIGLGANLPEDAIYATAQTDHKGAALEGGQTYQIRFEKDELPPTRAFWSFTVYDEHDFLLDHPSRHYSLNSFNDIWFDEDGALTIALQTERPTDELARNWIATPSQGEFSVVLRIYWPEESVLSGQWSPSQVQKMNAQ